MKQDSVLAICVLLPLVQQISTGSPVNVVGNAKAPRWDCEWRVHYNTWIPSFKPGEYRHNGPSGGAHCLDACCQDPTCTGIQLESSEQFQCYEYGSPPKGLNDVTPGRRLGDGSWLVHQRPAWSVFMKASRRKVSEVIGMQPPPLPAIPEHMANRNDKVPKLQPT